MRMDRYTIETIEFASDLSSVGITFLDHEPTHGPVTERRQWVIHLLEDIDLRESVASIVEDLCQLIDDAYAPWKKAGGGM